MKLFARFLTATAVAGLALAGASYTSVAGASTGAPASGIFDHDCCNN
ncbi:hypothetical protein [Nonomuraea mesophila]|nr:hypothetical protein [Nonomuraea mesophila]